MGVFARDATATRDATNSNGAIQQDSQERALQRRSLPETPHFHYLVRPSEAMVIPMKTGIQRDGGTSRGFVASRGLVGDVAPPRSPPGAHKGSPLRFLPGIAPTNRAGDRPYDFYGGRPYDSCRWAHFHCLARPKEGHSDSRENGNPERLRPPTRATPRTRAINSLSLPTKNWQLPVEGMTGVPLGTHREIAQRSLRLQRGAVGGDGRIRTAE